MKRSACALFVGLLLAGCAETSMSLKPSATVTTTVVGWESWLRLDWTAQTRPDGTDIDGYVVSFRGAPIHNVQVLAQGLDAAGNVVATKIDWVQGIVPGHQRTYFRIAGLPRAERYRVSVWTFESIEGKGFL